MRTLPTGKTPYELATGHKPDLTHLVEFGTTAYVRDHIPEKIGSKTSEGTFVGVGSESKGVRVYWKARSSVTVEADVIFNREETLEAEDLPGEG